ncbi:hypothetical protein FACS189472_16730 [Alphaproteobacteria bacterium]|nr:hypothetical protein FACS189472_16730 [Alphaproteobacteria bacterium]
MIEGVAVGVIDNNGVPDGETEHKGIFAIGCIICCVSMGIIAVKLRIVVTAVVYSIFFIFYSLLLKNDNLFSLKLYIITFQQRNKYLIQKSFVF